MFFAGWAWAPPNHVALLTFSAFSRRVAPWGKRPSLERYENVIAKWQARMVFSCFSMLFHAFPTNVLRMSSNTIQQGIFNRLPDVILEDGSSPWKKKLMWSTHLNIFRVLVLEKSINIGYFARGNLRSDQTNWVSSWGLGMPRNLNRSAINHINLKLQTYSFFFITDWCSLSMFQPVSACSSLFQPVPAIQIPGWDPKHFTHLRRRLGRAAWFPRPAENLFLTKLCSSNWAYTVYGHFGKSPYGIWFFCSIYGYFPNGDINLLFCYIYLVV